LNEKFGITDKFLLEKLLFWENKEGLGEILEKWVI